MSEKEGFKVTNISENGNIGLFWLGKDNLSVYDVVRLLNELSEENERLKAQLYCKDEDGVCHICEYRYLVSDGKYNYYIAKCQKGYEECSMRGKKYCDDFNLKIEYGDSDE